MDEFDFIATHLAPLAGPGGLDLKDDAALFKPPSGKDLILTKDTMVEGVHFPKGHYGGDTAEKLLRVNLSDLAAKGARPIGYMLSIAWPNGIDNAFYGGFASGLRDIQEGYDFKLFGGDTVSTDGPMVVTATFLGEVPTDEMVTRSGAKVGDDIWITGTIGDAYLGLQSVLGNAFNPKPSQAALLHFEEAYYRPEPQLLFRKILRKHASACSDISDGLVADVSHVAQASCVKFLIAADKVPFSRHVGQWLSKQANEGDAFQTLVTAGDDYELVFTASSDSAKTIRQSAAALGLRVTKVGVAERGEGISVISDGKVMEFSKMGHTHF